MGQAIVVTAKPGGRPGVVIFECNRSLTGMQTERYPAPPDDSRHRPPDVLARQLFDLGARHVTIYSNIVVVEATDELVVSLGEMPGVNERGDPQPVVDVGIDVRGDLLTGGPRGLKAGDRQRHLPPVLPSGCLQVEDVHGHFRFAADLQRLVDRLQQPVAFVPHVRVVAAAVLAGHASQLGDLLRRGIHGRRIDEGGGDADGPGLHPLAHEVFHPPQLVVAGAAIHVANDDLPHLSEPNRLHDVDR